MNNKFFITLCMLILFFLLSCTQCLYADDVIFIMHKQVKDPIKPSIIKKIYLGKVSRWNDNQRVRFYTFDSDDTTETFTKKYLSKSKRQFNKYWKRQVFTGKGNIPKSIKSVEEAIKIVSKTKGAIVYLPEQKIDNETIRIVSITN